MNKLKITLPLFILVLISLKCDKSTQLIETKGEFDNTEEIKEFTKLWQLVLSDYPRAEKIRHDLIGKSSYNINSYLDSQTLSKMIPFKDFELKDTFILHSSFGVYAQNKKTIDTIIHVNIKTYCNQLKSKKLNTWLIKSVSYKIKNPKNIKLELDYYPQYKYFPDYKNNYSKYGLKIKQEKNEYSSLFTIRQELVNNSDSLVLQQLFPTNIMQDDFSKKIYKKLYGKECNIIVKTNRSYFKNNKTKIAYKELTNK